MSVHCQYCSSPVEHQIEPYPGAGYTQDLCARHYDEHLDMLADEALEGR